jgi:glycerol-3-phosphate responsive antiterminator
MNFLTHHVGMMSLLQHKVISSIIGNLKKKHNKAILTLHFIHGPKEHNSFISPYLCKYHR